MRPTLTQRIGKAISSFGSSAKAWSTPFISSITGRYQYLTTPLNARNYLEQFKNWVFACVQARAEEVGNIELILLDKNDKVIKNHAVLDLLKKVNPSMTKHELFFATQAFKDLDGNAFWYLARDGKNRDGEILEIYPLRPDKVQIVPDPTNPIQIGGYVFTQPDGQKIPFEPQEILHFRNFNPLGYHPFPHRGMGIVEGAAWAIDTDNEARRWNLEFFKNNGRPDGILTTAGDSAMDDGEYKRLQEEWNAKHSGQGNAHKVAVLSGGTTWTEITRSQKDMDFNNQRTFSRDEILSLFRTPKSILGITDDVNRANADAAIYIFALRTVKPLMQQMVDTLNEYLMPEFGDNLTLSFESPVAEDRKESLDEYASALPTGSSWLTINEVRERENLEPIPGGDSLYVPLAVQEVATVGEPAPIDRPEEPAPAAPAPAPTEEPAAPPAKGKKGKKAAAVPAAPTKESIAEAAVKRLLTSHKAKTRLPLSQQHYRKGQLTKLAKQQYIEIWKQHVNISGTGLEKATRKFFDRQEKEVLANVAEQLKGFEPDEFKHKALFDFLFDQEEAVAASVSFVTPFIQDYIKRSGENAQVLIGSQTFDPTTQSLQDFVKSRANYFAETINDTTREDLLTSIKQGVDAGEGLQDIEQRVANVYDIATGSRTQMIARTEVSAASNQGSIGAYKQAGIEKIEWAVVNPEDEDCIENDGEVVSIGAAFTSGDTEPPVHPNCECTTLPVFDDEQGDE